MALQFQLSVRNALLATGWVAAWLGACKWAEAAGSEWGYLVVSLVVSLPAAAVGALLGRQWQGILCGVASALGWLAFMLWLSW